VRREHLWDEVVDAKRRQELAFEVAGFPEPGRLAFPDEIDPRDIDHLGYAITQGPRQSTRSSGGKQPSHDRAECGHAAQTRDQAVGADAGHSNKARQRLGWALRWNLDQTLGTIIEWHAAHVRDEDLRAVRLGQIERYERAGPSGKRG
jgi:hypothetical protein